MLLNYTHAIIDTWNFRSIYTCMMCATRKLYIYMYAWRNGHSNFHIYMYAWRNGHSNFHIKHIAQPKVLTKNISNTRGGEVFEARPSCPVYHCQILRSFYWQQWRSPCQIDLGSANRRAHHPHFSRAQSNFWKLLEIQLQVLQIFY